MSKEKTFVTKPTLAPLDDFKSRLEGAWETGVLTHNGPLVQQFEKEVKKRLDISNLVATSNGTIALQMAIKALDIQGEIITSPFTWVATISSIIWEKCTPVFVDIDPHTLNLDPSKIESKITDHTVAIMPIHVFGNACDVEGIGKIANKHNLKVIYDAAHAVGVKFQDRSILDCGDISVTSFHATKMLNTAEGGACCSTDEQVHEKLKRIRFFGHNEVGEIVEDGFNGKMTEVHAALGLANLPLLVDALTQRETGYKYYKELLGVNPNLTYQKIPFSCNFSYFPVIFPSEDQMLNVIDKLLKEDIYPRRYFYPSVNTFSNIVQYDPMPISEDISKRIICLPLYFGLSEKKIEQISNLVLSQL